ncbi:MAG TPA: GFA family protein [Rhizobiaceae bacterium]|nr:GFA family protein [Rhizobiaceae bacterium]
MTPATITGGCQCGAVRYRAHDIGRASICHCRMCQKASGNYFMPLLEVGSLEWTRGKRGVFASSNLSSRGFCQDCGTPLTLETPTGTGLSYEVMIGSLDNPSAVNIDYHANKADRLEIATRLNDIPEATAERNLQNDAWNARIVSHQHPDHDTPT